MDKAAKLKLRQFIEDNVPFYELKKVGFWPRGTKKNDYEKIADRWCQFFNLKSIYEYGVKVEEWMSKGRKPDRPEHWPKLKIDVTDMLSKDSWLN
ncbi:hypothetical protein [Chitinophaga pinensis]|uniref:Uncharacterized protein n=1 Tax=Chitinophaga pinensis (strain ATCC 43595 / DSM 2588 / LMG 13176 / NBRC 15968 / NCIMB 11800 / UQM 2034) TaxID=485918 RepID=A0A979GXP8_CHIPD|nr:hypothetical protein [Chitinophaga pinensis]ACU61325.1 hypothetical protein Cpin_3863 [Chitinophaga pinensis DSM 2588]